MEKPTRQLLNWSVDISARCLSVANAIDIDLSDAILEKLEQNKNKYPADLYKGRAYLEY